MKWVNFTPNEIIFKENTIDENMNIYLIAEGEVAIMNGNTEVQTVI